jgi:hypothetical protein
MKKINLFVPKDFAKNLYKADVEVRNALIALDKELLLKARREQKTAELEIETFLGKKLSSIDFFEIVDHVRENPKIYE